MRKNKVLCKETDVECKTKIASSHAKLAEEQPRKGACVARCGVPKCGRMVPPDEVRRIDFERIQCPVCGERFVVTASLDTA